MKIGPHEIGPARAPYIVAELSCSHSGSILKARQLIGAAKRAGADACKTQAYEPDTITLDINKSDFIIQDGLWKGRTLYELYSKAYTPFKWHPELYKIANDLGITIFSSVFDYSSIDLLERLGCPAYKIASMEIVDIPLIQRVERCGVPALYLGVSCDGGSGWADRVDRSAKHGSVPGDRDIRSYGGADCSDSGHGLGSYRHREALEDEWGQDQRGC